jgi:hypothetical protein
LLLRALARPRAVLAYKGRRRSRRLRCRAPASFASLSSSGDYDTAYWRHLACVTPKVAVNVQTAAGSVENVDVRPREQRMRVHVLRCAVLRCAGARSHAAAALHANTPLSVRACAVRP